MSEIKVWDAWRGVWIFMTEEEVAYLIELHERSDGSDTDVEEHWDDEVA